MKTMINIRPVTVSEKVALNMFGEHTQLNRKEVVRINDLKLYVSMTDAAEDNDTSICTVSYLSRHGGTMRNGTRFCLLRDLPKYINEVHNNIIASNADAEKWRTHEAEQEEIRKAEEKRQEELRKAEEERQQKIHALQTKIEAQKRIYETVVKQAECLSANIADLEAELAELEK